MSYNFPVSFPVTSHTDFIGNGSTFVAIKGQNHDGASFIPEAITRGASTIVVQQNVILPDAVNQKIESGHIKLERVENPRRALAELSAQALGYPARKLKIIGITGTKGKTTTSFIMEHILKVSGFKTGLLSTVSNKIGDTVLPKNLTTPQPDYLHMFFAECVRQNVEWVIMEVSAQALTLDRIHDITFDGIIFTNFSQEHAEFYSSQDAYFQAKCLLFNYVKNGAPCILNADDIWFKHCVQQIKNKNCLSVSLYPQKSVIWAKILKNSFYKGLILNVYYGSGFAYVINTSHLIGTFNAYNSLMAASLATCLGVEPALLHNAFTSFYMVPGRMQRHVISNKALAIIDYAHTPSSFDAVLSTLRQATQHLIVIFGAGGNRDTVKRPEMGRIAAQYADTIFLTTDNPRDEDPRDIVNDILVGIDAKAQYKIIIELDRELAIKKAYQVSHAKSIIALLGKGTDEYQEINGVKIPFSEQKILLSL